MLPGSHVQGSPADGGGVEFWQLNSHFADRGASAFCEKIAKMDVRQCRMARAALDWTQHDLAKASGVSWRTITRFEAGESVLPARVQKLRDAFEAAGVLFMDSGRFAGGVAPPQTSDGV
jgi:DNA-binding XRE family transcriptional regulator